MQLSKPKDFTILFLLCSLLSYQFTAAQQISWNLIASPTSVPVGGKINGLNMGGYAYGYINQQSPNITVTDSCIQCLNFNCSPLVSPEILNGSEFSSMQTKLPVVTETAKLRPSVLRFPGGTHSGWYHLYKYDELGVYDAASPEIAKGYGMNVGESAHLANPLSYCKNDSRLTVQQNYIDGFTNFIENIRNATAPDTQEVEVTYVANLLTHYNFDQINLLCLQTCGKTPALVPMSNFICGQPFSTSYTGNEAMFNNDPNIYKFELYYKETQDALDTLYHRLKLDSGDVLYVEFGNEYYDNEGALAGYRFQKFGINAPNYAHLVEIYSERLKCYFSGKVTLKTGMVSKPGKTWQDVSNPTHFNYPGLKNLLGTDQSGDGSDLDSVVDAIILHDYYTSSNCLSDPDINSRFECAKTEFRDYLEGNSGLLANLENFRLNFPNQEIWLTEWNVVGGTEDKNINYINTPLHASFVMEYALAMLEYNANFNDRIAMSTHHRIGYDRPWSVIQTKDGDNSTAIVRASGHVMRYLNKLFEYDNRRYVAHVMTDMGGSPFDSKEAKAVAIYQAADSTNNNDRFLIYYTNKTGSPIPTTVPTNLNGLPVANANLSYVAGNHLFSYGPSNGSQGQNNFRDSMDHKDLALDSLGYGPLHDQLVHPFGLPVVPGQLDSLPANSVGVLEINLDPITNIVDATGLDFLVSPNPSDGRINIRTNSTHDSMGALEISAMDGRVIHHQTISLTSGENSYEVDLTRVPAGVYFIQLESGDGRRGRKIVRY